MFAGVRPDEDEHHRTPQPLGTAAPRPPPPVTAVPPGCTRPHHVTVRDASRSGLRPSRPDREAGRAQEQGTDVATLEQTRATIEAVAKMAAKLQGGVRERAVARGLRPHPAPPSSAPSHTPPPGAQQTPGRTPTGGLA